MTMMAQEIAEQPAAIARTLAALLPRRPELRQLVDGRRHLLFVGRGTSDNAGIYGRYLVEIHAGIGASLAAPSLATHYGVHRDLSDTVVVSLSQSGATEEIVATQAWAARCGARTVAVTNEAASPLAAGADVALVTEAGTERAVPATKSYTAQLVAIAVLADALAPEPGRLEAQLETVPGVVDGLLHLDVEVAIDTLSGARDTLVSGRGLVYGTALETALKLEETCLAPVRGLSYADLRHGPMAVVDEQLTAVLLAAADGPMLPGMVELAEELGRRGALTVGIGGDEAFRAACSEAIDGPGLSEALSPIGLIVPAQRLVEGLARRRGLDPDAPRSLSKITQTDA